MKQKIKGAAEEVLGGIYGRVLVRIFGEQLEEIFGTILGERNLRENIGKIQ